MSEPILKTEAPIDSCKSINYFLSEYERCSKDFLFIQDMLIKDLGHKMCFLESDKLPSVMASSLLSMLSKKNKDILAKHVPDADRSCNEKVDILFVTAIPTEFNAVVNCLSNKKTIKEPESVYEVGEYEFDKKSAKIAVVQTGEGNSNSAIHTTIAICKFQPGVVVMVGIGGGVKDVKVGDVVVGQYVHYYEMGKDDGQNFYIRPRGYEPTQTLLTRAEAISRDVNKSWLNLIPVDSRGNVYPDLGEPDSFVKPIAAGEKIGASKKADLIKLITANYNDTVLIEMEGFGFQKAVHKAGKQGIVIRGVSDIVKQRSNIGEKIRQKIAVERSVAFAFETLNLFLSP